MVGRPEASDKERYTAEAEVFLNAADAMFSHWCRGELEWRLAAEQIDRLLARVDSFLDVAEAA
jgi:hypothetical protein